MNDFEGMYDRSSMQIEDMAKSLGLLRAENQRLKEEKHIVECELTSARTLLKDALPNIECSNGNQDGLITAIGEYLAARPQKESE